MATRGPKPGRRTARRFRRSTSAPTASKTLRALFERSQEMELNITDLADGLDMTRAGVSYWKSGRCTPNILSVEELADFLDCDIVLKPRSRSKTDD